MYLSYFSSIKRFGLPPSVRCPVNKLQQCLPLALVSKGCTTFFFKSRMTLTLSHYLEESSSHNRLPLEMSNDLMVWKRSSFDVGEYRRVKGALITSTPTVFVGKTSKSKDYRKDTSNEKPVNNTSGQHVDGRPTPYQ